MDGPRGCTRRSPGVHSTTEPWPAASAVGARAGAGAATTAPSPLRPARRPAEAPRGARAAPPAAWLAARLRPRVARPQPPVGTRRPPSVLPLLQSVHVPARRCVSRKREPGPSPRERRLGESSLGDTARLHRLLLGGLQSPRPQEELEMCSSRRDPRGAGHVTGTTCCSARHSHRRRTAPGSGLAAAADAPGGPGPDPRDRTAERPAAPATSASRGCCSLRSGG